MSSVTYKRTSNTPKKFNQLPTIDTVKKNEEEEQEHEH